MDVLLALLEGLERLLVLRRSNVISLEHLSYTLQGTHLGQTPPDSASLLRSEVKRGVLLLLVQLAQVLPGLLVHDGQNPSDRLADSVTDVG